MALSHPATAFLGPKMTDMLKLGRTIGTAGVAIASRGLLSDADAAVSLANGIVELGPYDGAEFLFFGTDAANEAGNYVISLLEQVYNDALQAVSGYWVERPIASGVITLGAMQVSAAEGTAITGLAENDFLADTLTETLSLSGVSVYSPANDTVAFLRVPGLGAERMSIQTDLTTAAKLGCLVRRIQGEALRG